MTHSVAQVSRGRTHERFYDLCAAAVLSALIEAKGKTKYTPEQMDALCAKAHRFAAKMLRIKEEAWHDPEWPANQEQHPPENGS